jgi:AbrB family looped-hinge helix DNA binding protein
MSEGFKAKLNAKGRIVIPAALRRELGLKAGDELLLRTEDGELRVYTLTNAVRRAQEMVQHYARGKAGWVDAFLRERRAEARREERQAARHRPRGRSHAAGS